MLDGGIRAADHQAVATLESPDSAAGAYVDVVDAFGGEVFGAADVVDVVGVAAVDEDVAGFEMRGDLGDGVVDGRGGIISQMARGLMSLLSRSSMDVEAVRTFSAAICSTICGERLKPTHWCPFAARRRTMFAPILPRPIIPSCIGSS